VASGPYDYNWWGGDLLGVNGDSGNPGAPVVLNAGGTSTSLGAAVTGQLVYSAHDYGPNLSQQPWFNAQTCYTDKCSGSSLADRWKHEWAYIAAGEENPVTIGSAPYPWSNTGTTPYTAAPVWIGEFGTGNTDADLMSSGPGSQGQWFTDLTNFIQSSYNLSPTNNPGLPNRVTDLNWTDWALNSEDSYALLGSGYTGLAWPKKEYSFLCAIQQGSLAVQPSSGCGTTGPLPSPS
jgi:endoglucanase